MKKSNSITIKMNLKTPLWALNNDANFVCLCSGHRRSTDDEPERQSNSQPQTEPGVELVAYCHHPKGQVLLLLQHRLFLSLSFLTEIEFSECDLFIYLFFLTQWPNVNLRNNKDEQMHK